MDNGGVLDFVTSPHPQMVVNGVSVVPAMLLDALKNTVQVQIYIVLGFKTQLASLTRIRFKI